MWKCREEKRPLFFLSKLKETTEYINEDLSSPACLLFLASCLFVFWLSNETVSDLVSFKGKSNFTH